MTDFNELKKKWLKDPKIVAEYEALAPEFANADQLIRARAQTDSPATNQGQPHVPTRADTLF